MNISNKTKIGEKETLRLFHKVAIEVPAYVQFLKKNNLDPKKIASWNDFQSVPSINKKNYLSQYELKDLVWGGKLNHPLIYTATSGSTGKPFYFMRRNQLDWQYSLIIEKFLKNSSLDLKKPTLVIICFGMGIWIGGLITYKGFEIAAVRNDYPLSIITPGINKNEIFSILSRLAPQYEQLVFVGYPPFVKDVFDEAEYLKINLKKFKIGILFAAESVTEQFRDYIAKSASIKNIYNDIINIYGSADLGAMAYETGLSVLIRRLALQKKEVFNQIFSPINKTPTLAQFDPKYINFESVNGEIFISADSALPLIRYGIGDRGGVFAYEDIIKVLKANGIDLIKEATKANIKDINKLPFVYVYERSDLSATFYGMWIYPEWFRSALLTPPFNKYLSGKFTLMTVFDSKQNQLLEINLEMKKDIKEKAVNKEKLCHKMVATLRQNSSEYRELSDKLKQKAWPTLKLWPYESVNYFKPGIKQKWVKK